MVNKLNNMRSPLGRARGLGAAKQGVHHWLMQRITALALIPLTLWFVFSLVRLQGADYGEFRGWVANPFDASALILFIAVGVHHAFLGMQVVTEDYVSNHGIRFASVIVERFFCYGLGVLGIVSVVIVALGH